VIFVGDAGGARSAARGVANFEVLHSQAHDGRAFLYAFGLLELGGVDLRPYPLEEGRGRLQSLLRKV